MSDVPETPDELVPNCVTCRQHFEDVGMALMVKLGRQYSGRDEAEAAQSRYFRDFHEEHKPHDN